MRRIRKKRGKPTERKSPVLLTASSRKRSRSLEKRVRCLEGRVEVLERGQGINAFPGELQKKSGPRLKISDEELLGNRNALVDWLEVYWPDVGPKLLSAMGQEEIVAALVPYVVPETGRGLLVKRLIENAGDLLSFLRSNRFRRKPAKRAVVDALNEPWNGERQMTAAAKLPTRQIANAMAGVPELEWRTSLDRCSRVPSNLAVGKTTGDHYRELFRVPLPKRRARDAKP